MKNIWIASFFKYPSLKLKAKWLTKWLGAIEVADAVWLTELFLMDFMLYVESLFSDIYTAPISLFVKSSASISL